MTMARLLEQWRMCASVRWSGDDQVLGSEFRINQHSCGEWSLSNIPRHWSAGDDTLEMAAEVIMIVIIFWRLASGQHHGHQLQIWLILTRDTRHINNCHHYYINSEINLSTLYIKFNSSSLHTLLQAVTKCIAFRNILGLSISNHPLCTYYSDSHFILKIQLRYLEPPGCLEHNPATYANQMRVRWDRAQTPRSPSNTIQWCSRHGPPTSLQHINQPLLKEINFWNNLKQLFLFLCQQDHWELETNEVEVCFVPRQKILNQTFT